MLDLKMHALQIVPLSVIRCGGQIEYAVSMPTTAAIRRLWKSLGIKAPYPREDFWARVLREALRTARETAVECGSGAGATLSPRTTGHDHPRGGSVTDWSRGSPLVAGPNLPIPPSPTRRDPSLDSL